MINLQIESRVKEFFGLVCLHSYYSDTITRDLEFEPTPETARLLKNYQLVFKPLPFGFLVLYHPDYSPQRLESIPPRTRFSFRIVNRNPRFMNFSEVPFWPEGVVFHYSNFSPEKAEIPMDIPAEMYYYFKQLNVANSEKKLVHLPQHKLVPVRPAKFSYNVSTEGENEGLRYSEIIIRDEWGNEQLPDGTPYKRPFSEVNREEFRRHLDHATRKLKKEGYKGDQLTQKTDETRDQLEKELSEQARSSQTLDLKHVPFGKYIVEFGKYGKSELYTSENPGDRIFGMIDIYPEPSQDGLLNKEAKDPEGLVTPQLYHLHFEGRTTYWRYFFMNYKNSNITPTLIKDESQELDFTEPQAGILESVGTKAMIAETKDPVQLKDRPQYVLTLERMNGKRSMKEMRLPLPNADAVKPVRSGDEVKIYSDVFVYL